MTAKKAQQCELVAAEKSQEQTAIATRDDSAYGLIMRAVSDEACDPAKLEKLLAVRQQWEADEARKEFARDMADFQSRCPIIAKLDKAYDKQYARIDRIHRETRDLRRECGFWFTWQACEIVDGMAHMEGMLGHRGGHTMPIKQVIPLPDAIKGQNQTQRAGSAQTYAKRYAECLALDIVTGEDDDGAGGVCGHCINEEQAANLRELCEAAGRPLSKVLAMAGVTSVEQYPVEAYKNAAAMLAQAANKGR